MIVVVAMIDVVVIILAAVMIDKLFCKREKRELTIKLNYLKYRQLQNYI